MSTRKWTHWHENYAVDEDSGCWNWLGARHGNGYGQIRRGRKYLSAHRVYYERFIGPIPQGLVIDHLCCNTLCVNPHHMEAVTDRVNILRGRSLQAENALKTHCKHGHPFDEENTYRYRGNRFCRACNRRATAAYYRRTHSGGTTCA